MVGGIGPGDDPLQLTGRAEVPGADGDAGRRSAGRLSHSDDARRGEHGSLDATLGVFSVDSDHAHCMTVVRHDDLAPL